MGVISKVLLKAVGSAKKDSKTFTFHNVDSISVNTQEKLKLYRGSDQSSDTRYYRTVQLLSH